jgi:hypothetical protein
MQEGQQKQLQSAQRVLPELILVHTLDCAIQSSATPTIVQKTAFRSERDKRLALVNVQLRTAVVVLVIAASEHEQLIETFDELGHHRVQISFQRTREPQSLTNELEQASCLSHESLDITVALCKHLGQHQKSLEKIIKEKEYDAPFTLHMKNKTSKSAPSWNNSQDKLGALGKTAFRLGGVVRTLQ